MSSPFIAATRGFVDTVIEPAQTRMRVISAFEMLSSKNMSKPAKKHGNIPL